MNGYAGIHHASVIVADTDRALAFYAGILQIPMDPGRPDLGFPGAWLSVGDQQIHLLEVANPDPTSGRPAHGGRDRHIALLVQGLDAIAARMEQHAVDFTRSRSGRRALFCRDPDGNALELIEAP